MIFIHLIPYKDNAIKLTNLSCIECIISFKENLTS